MAKSKIRVGIIGVQPDRSWAAIAHIPALQALPDDYEITAVSTTRQSSADEAAARYGIPQAFDNYQSLVTSPDVDLVAVTVKVPAHLELVLAALEAGKHVYCEWPLGNGLAEAERMAALARQKGVRCVIGMQARFAPAIAYAKDLIAEGYVGEVLSADVIGTGMNWGEYVDQPNAYTADKSNGATVLTIPVGHTIDAVCHLLGEISALTAVLANRRKTTLNVNSGESLRLTSEDQVAFIATLTNGTILSAHYRGGMSKGTGLSLEINGTKGDLRLTAIGGHAQIFDLSLLGATGEEQAVAPLEIPAKYFPTSITSGPAANVAAVYAQFARDLREGTKLCPDFDDAVRRHKMIDAIERSSASGTRQSLPAGQA
jgi:predicted dehydrogenase